MVSCNFVVVRFVPDKTVGEFVNIGVVMKCNDYEWFDYMITDWNDRMESFFKRFEGVDKELYDSAVGGLCEEIKLCEGNGGNIMNKIVKPLDGVIQFSDVYSGIAHADKLQEQLIYLFQKYVSGWKLSQKET